MRRETTLLDRADLRLIRLVKRTKHRIKNGEYETGTYDRILIPVPARFREQLRPWLGKDLKIQIEPFNLGLSLLIYPENRLLRLYPMSQRFRYLLRQLESEAGIPVSKGEELGE